MSKKEYEIRLFYADDNGFLLDKAPDVIDDDVLVLTAHENYLELQEKIKKLKERNDLLFHELNFAHGLIDKEVFNKSYHRIEKFLKDLEAEE